MIKSNMQFAHLYGHATNERRRLQAPSATSKIKLPKRTPKRLESQQFGDKDGLVHPLGPLGARVAALVQQSS